MRSATGLTTLTLLALAMSLGAACASVDYTPPPPADPPQLEVTIEAPFAEVWSRLVAYLESRAGELSIRRMERDLGQVEITFGPVDPSTWVECGQVKSRRPDYSGSLTGWLAQHYDGKLYGELVMRALRGHEDRTPVTLEVRYSLSAARGDRDYSMQFNSASPGKLRSGTTCRTNHVLEENVVAALRGL